MKDREKLGIGLLLISIFLVLLSILGSLLGLVTSDETSLVIGLGGITLIALIGFGVLTI